jgi:autophagy-related protein 101
MNARTKQLQLTIESRQVKDTAQCFFHTLLLHRTIGKFKYCTDTNYTVGSLGLQEIICEEIDLAYVRVNSPELCMDVDKEVSCISDAVETATRAGGFIVGSSPQSSASSPNVRLYGIGLYYDII